MNSPASYAQIVMANQDFPQDTHKKAIPTNVTLGTSTKTENMIIEVMTMMKEQNKIMSDLLLRMNQINQIQI